MDFQQLADAADAWCAGTPFQLIAAEETERRMDFYADPGVSFYVLCPDSGGADTFHVWSESEDCLPFLQMAQDYISSCGKKTLHEILEKVFKSFRPDPKLLNVVRGLSLPPNLSFVTVRERPDALRLHSLILLGLPDVEDEALEDYNADVEEDEPEADHQRMGVSQQ